MDDIRKVISMLTENCPLDKHLFTIDESRMVGVGRWQNPRTMAESPDKANVNCRLNAEAARENITKLTPNYIIYYRNSTI